MSESKKRNVNTPRQCRGCKNYTRIDDVGRIILQGCKYTKYGNGYIRDCPCSKCLVKAMCIKPCPNLIFNYQSFLYLEFFELYNFYMTRENKNE